MTIEQALAMIRSYRENVIGDWAEVFDIAIKSLEKQSPKNYTIKESHWEGVEIISCPVCSHAFGTYLAKDYCSKESAFRGASCNNKFCPNCSQAINWREEE